MPSNPVALVTGIAGALAQFVSRELHGRGYSIIGVDYRPLEQKLEFPIEVYQANYNKTRIEDIFRRHRPSHVLHLGRVGNLKETMNKRFDLNVIGSRKVMDLSLKYGAKRLIVLSTFHIYGAHPQNHTPIGEEDPLRAGTNFPQIADAIQLDNQAVIWTYRHPEVKTALLRPCNVIGPRIKNAMSNFLRMPNLPYMIGFNPMTQFVHEQDLSEAIVAVNENSTAGVFNVAGPSGIPWRDALRLTGHRLIPVPSLLAHIYLRAAGAVTKTFPPYLIRFFMYPCVIDDSAVRETFKWQPRVRPEEAIRSTVSGTDVPPRV